MTKKSFIAQIILALLASLYLQVSHGAQKPGDNPDLAMQEISARIALLEQEVKLIKIQRQKTERLTHEVQIIEKNLESLQVAVKQNAVSINNIGKTTSEKPESPKASFFVPAGW